MSIIRIIATCFIGVLFLLILSVSAQGIGGKPANPLHNSATTWFVYNLSQGESYEDVVEVVNYLDTPALVKLIAVDGLSHDSSEAFILKGKDEEMTEMGEWIVFENEYVIVPPNSSVLANFTVMIPQDYTPLSRRTTGAILFENVSHSMSNAYAKTEGASIALTMKQGVRIYNTIPR